MANVLRSVACCHFLICFFKDMQSKAFAEFGRGSVISFQGILIGVHFPGLLELLHQICRVFAAFCVGLVEIGGEDLFRNVEAHCDY